MYDNYGFATEVITANVRHSLHVVEAILAGSHIATIPYRVLKQMIKHPLTDIGITRFLTDYEKIPKKSDFIG
ncbi:MAG: transaldolase family protein [bacterium]|nr:transaldolase family protein [bacterium]